MEEPMQSVDEPNKDPSSRSTGSTANAQEHPATEVNAAMTNETGNAYCTIVGKKGKYISSGATSDVELLPSGDVIKTPFQDGVYGDDCRKAMAIEAQIYQRLGEHPRFLKVKHWDTTDHSLTLEYMPNGTLRDYMNSHTGEILLAQKLKWVSQAAESLSLLHSAGIIHCDVGPHNFFLDLNLNLKIADFGGSSVYGSHAMAFPGSRYAPPDADWRKPPAVAEDLFALGSTIYFIITGHVPFEDLEDDDVQEMYTKGFFPDLVEVHCGDIISSCWLQITGSAQEIRQAVDILILANVGI